MVLLSTQSCIKQYQFMVDASTRAERRSISARFENLSQPPPQRPLGPKLASLPHPAQRRPRAKPQGGHQRRIDRIEPPRGSPHAALQLAAPSTPGSASGANCRMVPSIAFMSMMSNRSPDCVGSSWSMPSGLSTLSLPSCANDDKSAPNHLLRRREQDSAWQPSRSPWPSTSPVCRPCRHTPLQRSTFFASKACP